MRRPVVAIDGPSGSGKSTLAARLAVSLGLPYLNTGLMYRALTLRAVRVAADLTDGPALGRLAATLTFDLDPTLDPPSLRIDGNRPDPALASSEVESRVSTVSAHPEVREALRGEQRRLGQGGAVVVYVTIDSLRSPVALRVDKETLKISFSPISKYPSP